MTLLLAIAAVTALNGAAFGLAVAGLVAVGLFAPLRLRVSLLLGSRP